MKILHISTAVSWRGGEQQIAYLIDELNRKGIEQKVLCAAGSPMYNYCIRNEVDTITFTKRVSFDVFFAFKVYQTSKDFLPDIIHLHDSHAHTGAIVASVIGMNTNIVLHRRVDFQIRENIFSQFKYSHSQIKKIICVSDAIRNILSKKINSRNLITIHSAADCNRFMTNNESILRNEYNIPDDVKIVANVAAIAPHKDYPTFLKTIALLKEKNLNAKYFIIGDGPERANIEKLIKEMELSNDVILTGFRNDIQEIFQEIDVLLFTSETEGLGTTILDAFCCKVPVAATNAGGIPEMIEHKKTGLLSDVKDFNSLAENVFLVLEDAQLRMLIIENAFQKVVNQFSKETMAAKTIEVYNEVLES